MQTSRNIKVQNISKSKGKQKEQISDFDFLIREMPDSDGFILKFLQILKKREDW